MVAHIFDFDGVILDSAYIKEREFLNLYKGLYGDIRYIEIKSYLESNPGVPRKVKISHIELNILKTKDAEQSIDRKLDEFGLNVFNKVVRAEFIHGVKDYLDRLHQDQECLLFISSATPDEELGSIVKILEIQHYFNGVYGSNLSKQDAIRIVIADNELSNNEVIFYGDSPNDLIAATDLKVNFIGVGAMMSNFDVKCIKDFIELL